MYPEKLQQVALCLLPGVGPVTIKQLISYCGSASAVFSAGLTKLAKIQGIGPKTAKKIKLSTSLELAMLQLELAETSDTRIHFFTEKQYPSRLKTLPDTPALVYTTGTPAYDNARTLGIVGTRKPTNYGVQVVKRLLKELVDYRPTIISGLAYGIDICAHSEALRLGLPTIGVLGSGLDCIYPSAHYNISRKMLDQGSLITEFPFGTKPEAYNFPSRNRIIAALSDALVVVEARNKGGAMITVRYTNQYGKPCFAVPGSIDAPASVGCNQLIKEKNAKIITSGLDVVSALEWKRTVENESPTLDQKESGIIEVLSRFPQGLHIDKLCWQTQVPIGKMGLILLELEIRGLIKSLPGKKFTLRRK